MDIALLMIRIVVGTLFVLHGTQKLFGWFGGHGIAGTAGFLESLGYRNGRAQAIAAGVAETGAGVLLAAGLLTPLACAAIVAVMVNAVVSVHWRNGLVQSGGSEYPLVLATLAIALAFVGAGAFSLDAALGMRLNGPAWGAAALALGMLSALVALGVRKQTMSPLAIDDAREDRAA